MPISPPSSNRRYPARVLFLGTPERLAPSSPRLTLARALDRQVGQRVAMFSKNLEREDTREWLRVTQKVSSIIVEGCEPPRSFLLRQLALAVAQGTQLIRWWVGTDVMKLLGCPVRQRSSRILQRICSAQVAVSPHLVDELRSVGIHAKYIPSVLDPVSQPKVLDHVPRRLLVYLPYQRREFYGASIVQRAVEEFPDIHFDIVADDPMLWDAPNVSCIGWVSDMEPIWNRVGGLLRVTQHDGMPRMVLDALRRGKHVLYSWPLAGCSLTTTIDEVRAGIDAFRKTTEINREGMLEFARLNNPTAEQQFTKIIRQGSDGASWQHRTFAAYLAVAESLKVKNGARKNGARKNGARKNVMNALAAAENRAVGERPVSPAPTWEVSIPESAGSSQEVGIGQD